MNSQWTDLKVLISRTRLCAFQTNATKLFFQPDAAGRGALTDANRKVFGLCKFKWLPGSVTCQNTHSICFHIIWDFPIQPIPILPGNSLKVLNLHPNPNKKKKPAFRTKSAQFSKKKHFYCLHHPRSWRELGSWTGRSVAGQPRGHSLCVYYSN